MENNSKVRVSKSNFDFLLENYHLMYGECNVEDDVMPEDLVEDEFFNEPKDREIVLYHLHEIRKEWVMLDEDNRKRYGNFENEFDLQPVDGEDSEDLKIVLSFHNDAMCTAMDYLCELAIMYVSAEMMHRLSVTQGSNVDSNLSGFLQTYTKDSLLEFDDLAYIRDAARDHVSNLQNDLKCAQA